MSVEENKALVRRWIEEGWNEGHNKEADDPIWEIWAEDWFDRNPLPGEPQGRDGSRVFVQIFRAAIADPHLEIEHMLGEGDWVSFRWIATGTHQGEFMGIPATGKQVRFSGITTHRIVNGQIAESYAEIDLLGLMQQLQAGPAS